MHLTASGSSSCSSTVDVSCSLPNPPKSVWFEIPRFDKLAFVLCLKAAAKKRDWGQMMAL
jgi:hypothetical protein